MAMRINHAILHVFDFEAGGTSYAQRELDLADRPTKSYVQRHLRKVSSSAESNHGTFAPESAFASSFDRYVAGGDGFVAFSRQIAEFLYGELRTGEDIEPCDVLVADFEDDADASAAAEQGDEEAEQAAFEGRGERRFAILLLPRKQAFAHDVYNEGGFVCNGIVRHDAMLPNPTQRIDSYAVIDVRTREIDFHDKERTIAGSSAMLIPDALLQCSKGASSKEVLEQVTRIVEDVASEYGANTAVALSKAKARIAEKAVESEYLPPWELGEEVFEDEPVMRERFAERAREEELPETVSVKRSVANRMAKSHRIRTDTGIEITFPSEYSTNPDFIQFINEADGSISIELRNIGSIENR